MAPDSIYGILHRECFRLFPDEMFADLFDDVGRRSVPQVGGYASTIRWNLVHGCGDITTAVRRAGYLAEAVAGAGRAEEVFWDDQASMVLAALLHAAALAGAGVGAVHAWAGGQARAPLDILQAHPGASAAARDHLGLYLSLPDRTRQSIAVTLARVLKFMLFPACAQAVTTADGGTVRVRTTGRDHGGGRRGHEDMLLLPAAALRMLPAGRAVVIQGRAAPVIVRVEQVRRRADYKRQPSCSVPAVRPATASPQIPAAMPGLLHDRPAGTLPEPPDDLTPAVTAGPES